MEAISIIGEFDSSRSHWTFWCPLPPLCGRLFAVFALCCVCLSRVVSFRHLATEQRLSLLPFTPLCQQFAPWRRFQLALLYLSFQPCERVKWFQFALLVRPVSLDIDTNTIRSTLFTICGTN